MAWACWDRRIADNFKNAPVPECIDLFEAGYLRKLDMTVEKNLQTDKANAEDVCAKFMHVAFQFNMLRPSLLGACTKYKERLCYTTNTIGDMAAVIMSKLVGHLVDQFKQGFTMDWSDWERMVQECIPKELKGLSKPDYWNEKRPDGRKQGKIHILDFLKFDVAGPFIHEILSQLDRTRSKEPLWFDGDLTKMYNYFYEMSKEPETCETLLRRLRSDIEDVSETWRKKMARQEEAGSDYVTKVKDIYETWRNIVPAEELRGSDLVRMLVEEWNKGCQLSLWDQHKASATFKFHHRMENFTWRMAGRQLCLLKLKQAGIPAETAGAMVRPEMWAALRPDKGFITGQRAHREAMMDEGRVAAMEEATDDDAAWLALDDA